MTGKGKDITDAEYYEDQEDYEDIQEYLDLTTPIEIDEKNLPAFKPDFSSAIVVDSIPVIGNDKYPRLLAALMKVFNQIAPVQESDVYLPLHPETNMTCGFCFVKYASKDDAEKAIKVLNGFAFDKKHTFLVTPYADLDTYAKIQADDKAPSFDFFPTPETSSWLSDTLSRDQFAIRHSGETEIYWANTTGEEPSIVYAGDREKAGGKKWCELTVEWSPQGTYFATFHKPGVKLWGGKDFQPQGRFIHAHVESVSFSPCENYLITYRTAEHPGADPNEAIIVWDVRTAEKIRSFSLKNPLDTKFQVKCVVQEEKNNKKVEREVRGRVASYHEDRTGAYFTIEEGNVTHVGVSAKTVVPLQDPNKLKWSPDGKYLARLGPDIISVYELPSMNLLEKKSIAAKDILDFVWSPRGNLISYWSPTSGNLPAMINIIRVPSRDNICSRKLFDVSEGKMVWQNEGDFLCVHACKTQNKKKTYVLMFFRVKDSGVPVEQTELTEPVLNVSWEPSGERVVIMSGDARNPTISFYSMSCQVPVKSSSKNAAPTTVTKNELTFLFSKTGFQCTDLYWSPAGGVIALAYFPTDGCMFELLDVDNNVVMATRRHDRCTKISWDPSGRYLATCTITDLRNTHARGQPDDGINFYNFQGTLLCQMKREKVYAFAWRPRPKDLLSPEERKKIIKNLRKYEKDFEREDKLRRQELNKELQAQRYKLAQEFIQWRNRNRSINAELKPLRVAIRDGYDSDDDNNYEIEVHVEEQVLKKTEQIVN